jgi:hypothetical protein
VANDAGYTLFIQAFISAGSGVNLGLAIWKLVLWAKFKTSSTPLVPLSLGLLILGNTGMHNFMNLKVDLTSYRTIFVLGH